MPRISQFADNRFTFEGKTMTSYVHNRVTYVVEFNQLPHDWQESAHALFKEINPQGAAQGKMNRLLESFKNGALLIQAKESYKDVSQRIKFKSTFLQFCIKKHHVEYKTKLCNWTKASDKIPAEFIQFFVDCLDVYKQVVPVRMDCFMDASWVLPRRLIFGWRRLGKSFRLCWPTWKHRELGSTQR